jgi:hypothetical protein
MDSRQLTTQENYIKALALREIQHPSFQRSTSILNTSRNKNNLFIRCPHHHNMKFELTPLILAYLATASLAEPERKNTYEVTVQLANDQSGANANVNVPTDGKERHIEALWGKTAVARNGAVYASSAQLTKFQQDSVCEIYGYRLDAKLNSRQTWVSLKGGSVVNLKDAYIKCDDY